MIGEIVPAAGAHSKLNEIVSRACSVHVFEIFNMFHWNQKGDPPGDDKKLDKVL